MIVVEMCPVKLEYIVLGAGRTYGWMSGGQVTKLLWIQELYKSGLNPPG